MSAVELEDEAQNPESPNEPSQLTPLRRTVEGVGRWLVNAALETGHVVDLSLKTIRAGLRRPFEFRATILQMEELGLKSLPITIATAVFIGIVMAIQFVFATERMGNRDMVGRMIGRSEMLQLAPSLTALVVGSRIGAGITAELGSMNVTEQIDAIRALGADPIRKLVLPRVLAGTLIMPLLTSFAFVSGVFAAALVCNQSFGMPLPFFLTTAIDTLWVADIFTGFGKTPFFGFLVTLLGCHYGMQTQGGTQGVGRATTLAVVGVSLSVLVSDAVLTQFILGVLRGGSH